MQRPSPLGIKPYTFPAVSVAQLENGALVHSVNLPGASLVTVVLAFDAGADAETTDDAGLASLTASSLAEGTHDRDADQLAEACELLGATLDTGVDWSQAQCGLTVPTARLAAAVELLSSIVQSPRLPEDGIHRLRAERLAELEQQRSEPRSVADDLFLQAVFAEGTRYRTTLGGGAGSVSRLQAADVSQFHRSRYTPAGLNIVVVGDVQPDVVRALCAQHLGGWRAAAPLDARDQEIAWPTGRSVWFAVREGAPQSELRVGHASVPRGHPDFYALTLLNAVFGGVFNSRINLNLRERHAFTYGAFSSFDWRRRTSAFEISTAVQGEHTAAALQEICSEIDRIREVPVSDDELSLARDYLTGVFPIRFETTTALATAVASRIAFQLPTDYFDTYRARMAAITRDDLLRVAQEHLSRERLQIAVVGDAAVESSLAQFGPLSRTSE